MARDPDTAMQEDLLEDIRRFPEKYPVSIGGLKPDGVADADRLLDPLDTANEEPLDGDDHSDYFGVHALDDGKDTFAGNEDGLDGLELDSEAHEAHILDRSSF